MSFRVVALVAGVAVLLPASAIALESDDEQAAPPAEAPAGAPTPTPAATTVPAAPRVERAPARAPATSPSPTQAPASTHEGGDGGDEARAAAGNGSEPLRKPARRKRKHDTARAAADASIRVVNFSFSPRTVTVNVGDRVTWTNRDSEAHDATDQGNFTTGRLSRGESGSATFEEAGTFDYICTIHPSMAGTVRVAGAGDGGSGGSGGDSGGGDSEGGDSGDDDGGGGSGGSSDSGNGTGGGRLADTGAELWPLALLGVGLLGAGIVWRRRLSPGD